MKEFREKIIDRQLSVRETEALIKRHKAAAPAAKGSAPAVDPHLYDLEEQLKRHFKAKVAIRKNGRGGKIEISYATMDELTRIIDTFRL